VTNLIQFVIIKATQLV